MKKNKIGIVTFHIAENYGAFLQTFASQCVLSDLFDDSEIMVVDYQPQYIKNTYKLYFPQKNEFSSFYQFVRSYLINLYFCPKRIYKKYKFRKAKKAFNLTSKYVPSDELREKLDYLVLGSDQIWNANITKGVDEIYYGKIKGTEKAVKIAYAASIGECDFSLDIRNEIKKNLQVIDAVSLREESSVSYLEKILERKYEIVLDPTLLGTKEFWSIHAKHIIKEKKYVLIYTLSSNEKIYEDATLYAKENDMEVVCIGEIGKKHYFINGVRIHSYPALDPFEFIGAFEHSQYVFTNSFHGTCFSIIFQKNFLTYLGEKRNGRIRDLTQKLGLEANVILYGKRAQNFFVDINYKQVEKKLGEYRLQSKEFLLLNIRR